MRYNRFGRPRKSTVIFLDFKIVQLADNVTREANRYFSNGRLTAIIQKNGNIAIKNSGIFDDDTSIYAQCNVATCLHGLKLIDRPLLETFVQKKLDKQNGQDYESLKSEAERLGYILKKKVK
jgi:hypothetical protein